MRCLILIQLIYTYVLSKTHNVRLSFERVRVEELKS